MRDENPATEAPEQGAVFAPTSVQKSRRPAIVASLVIVAVGGLIAVGALERGVPTAMSPPTATITSDATIGGRRDFWTLVGAKTAPCSGASVAGFSSRIWIDLGPALFSLSAGR